MDGNEVGMSFERVFYVVVTAAVELYAVSIGRKLDNGSQMVHRCVWSGIILTHVLHTVCSNP